MGIRFRRRRSRRYRRTINNQNRQIATLGKQNQNLRTENVKLKNLLGQTALFAAAGGLGRRSYGMQHRSLYRGFSNKFLQAPFALQQPAILNAVGSFIANTGLQGLLSAARGMSRSPSFGGANARINALHIISYRHAALI